MAVTILWRGLNSAKCRFQIAGVSKGVEQVSRRGCRSLLSIVQAGQRNITVPTAAGYQSSRPAVTPDFSEAFTGEVQSPSDPAVAHGSSKDAKLFLDCAEFLDISLREDGWLRLGGRFWAQAIRGVSDDLTSRG
ncbi:hypothetical protein [Hoyosella subflava]|uniref:hypothetical protein n=1 Tax=Hoyosella subflava TaxID=639313 RepID=UPI0011D22FB8|nr:hypothetical protein [Hoyosella subflava]